MNVYLERLEASKYRAPMPLYVASGLLTYINFSGEQGFHSLTYVGTHRSHLLASLPHLRCLRPFDGLAVVACIASDKRLRAGEKRASHIWQGLVPARELLTNDVCESQARRRRHTLLSHVCDNCATAYVSQILNRPSH